MEEKEKIMLAKNWILLLANGVNPLNGNVLKEDEVVNNVHISRCLFYVADLLGKYSERRIKSTSLKNVPFDSSALQKENYNYTDEISISAFAREIEKLIPENMKTVSYKSITTWLIQKGLLVESEDKSGKMCKVATSKGNDIGIYSEEREKNGRNYMATLYNHEAQRFLLEHLEEISRIQ